MKTVSEWFGSIDWKEYNRGFSEASCYSINTLISFDGSENKSYEQGRDDAIDIMMKQMMENN